jgi:hypothetical protein
MDSARQDDLYLRAAAEFGPALATSPDIGVERLNTLKAE